MRKVGYNRCQLRVSSSVNESSASEQAGVEKKESCSQSPPCGCYWRYYSATQAARCCPHGGLSEMSAKKEMPKTSLKI